MTDVRGIFHAQKERFFQLRAAPISTRIEKLKKLRSAIIANQEKIQKAIFDDFRKNPSEVDLTEVYTTLAELNFAIRHLKKWSKPQRVRGSLGVLGTRSQLLYEPKGVVLIIAPWNYPFSLMVTPLISALAAGNCVILKPSEITENTSHYIRELIESAFDPSEVAVVEGGPEITKELLSLELDHIFFTGSTAVGKFVAQAAAKNLVPVTLELGGKSPAIIDESADLKKSAERLAWGKFVNAGQTCIAPDYAWVPTRLLPQFVQEMNVAISKLYGASEDDRKKSQALCRIVNQRHFERLKQLTQDALLNGARAETGARFDENERYIAPTLLTGVKPEMAVMKEEIFGPVLPVLTYDRLDEIYSFLQNREKPLALYVFSGKKSVADEVVKNTTAGGTCINSALVHYATPHLPFGGIGASGQGSYHGFFGFRAFSHERAVLSQGWLDIFKHFYPPYTRGVKRLISYATRFLSKVS